MDRPSVALFLLLLLTSFAADAGVLSEKAETAAARKEAFVAGSEGWRFLPSELLFADKLETPDLEPIIQPAVDAITDFSGQLKQAGVALVVVPVPPKVLVHGSALGIDESEQLRMRGGWQKIMETLASRGVQVLDLLQAYRESNELMFCLRDTHWSGPGMKAAVERLLPVLKAAGVSTIAQINEPDSWQDFSIKGDLGGDAEKVKLLFPKDAGMKDVTSPVLLLGDSHVLVFHQGGELHTTGAGLPEQMASILGGMPEVVGVRGSGATSSRVQLARTIKSKPGYLENKKIVVWVFAGREFTEADTWKKCPVFLQKAAH